jgi:hypothetical protein
MGMRNTWKEKTGQATYVILKEPRMITGAVDLTVRGTPQRDTDEEKGRSVMTDGEEWCLLPSRSRPLDCSSDKRSFLQ